MKVKFAAGEPAGGLGLARIFKSSFSCMEYFSVWRVSIGGKKNQNQSWSLSLWGRSAKKVLNRDFYKAFLRATSSQEVRMFQINQTFCQIQKLSINNDHLVWQFWPRREVSPGEKLTSMSCVCVFVCLYLCFCTCVCLFVLVYLYLAILMTAGSFSWWQMSIHSPWFSPSLLSARPALKKIWLTNTNSHTIQLSTLFLSLLSKLIIIALHFDETWKNSTGHQDYSLSLRTAWKPKLWLWELLMAEQSVSRECDSNSHREWSQDDLQWDLFLSNCWLSKIRCTDWNLCIPKKCSQLEPRSYLWPT